MTPFSRALRNFFEKRARKFYEGPEPPARIAAEVDAFRVLYPNASPEQWSELAQVLAGNAYRDGYVRGFEWSERDPETAAPEMEPEEYAVMFDAADRQEQASAVEYVPGDPLVGIPVEFHPLILDELGERAGTHRVVVFEDGLRVLDDEV